MKLFAKPLVAVSVLTTMLMTSVAFAAQPLVDAAWLKSNLGKENLLVLDVRSAISGGSVEVFRKAHIPGAVYTDYLKHGWRSKDANGTIGQLPTKEKLAALIGGLGISNKTHVVIVPAGKKALDMGSATRVYWTFKVVGHDNVSILNGGFAGWIKDKANPVESGPNAAIPETFKVNFRPELLASKEDVKAAIKSGTELVDNRPNNQFLGINKHPAAKRLGTIPNAKNVPENWLTQNGGGSFRNPETLKKLYSAAKVSGDAAEINFCNTGHWASLGWFASHELLGNKKAKLYDGSMVEWTADKSAPMETTVKLN